MSSAHPRYAELSAFEKTGEHHAWDFFGAGDERGTLNFITPEAVRAAAVDRKDTARVLVWADDEHRVLAYVAVAPIQIERGTLPSRLARGNPDAIPAVLLARLALDQRLHGRGLGKVLLHDALATLADAVTRVGGRYIVVDAIDDAAAEFYRRHGFRPSFDPHRLVLRATAVVASFDRSG